MLIRVTFVLGLGGQLTVVKVLQFLASMTLLRVISGALARRPLQPLHQEPNAQKILQVAHANQALFAIATMG